MDEQGTKPATEGAPKTVQDIASKWYGGKDMAKDETAGEGQPQDMVKAWYKEATKEPAAEQDAKAAAVLQDYQLELPDGIVVDAPLRDAFTQLAREQNFTSEQAQRWADLHLRASGESAREVAEFREIGEKRYEEVESWKKEVESDVYAEKTLSQARKVLNSLGTPEEVERIRTELNRTGLGNHPVLIKGLARLARFVE